MDNEIRKALIYRSEKHATESANDINSNENRLPSIKHDFKLVEVEIREEVACVEEIRCRLMNKHSKRFYKVINPYVYYFGGGTAKIGLYRGERWELTSRTGNTVQITRSCVSMEISVREFIETFGEI